MIAELHIQNFKAHKNAHLESLGRLNVLAGLNGFGKSSVIQAFLLLRQSYLKNNILAQGLDLNGDLIAAGTGSDVFHKGAAPSELMQFSITLTDNMQFTWAFERGDDFLPEHSKNATSASLDKISIFNKGFQYIGAEHQSPKEVSPRSTPVVLLNRQISEKYGRGEYVAHFLAHYGSRVQVHEAIRHPLFKDKALLADQVNAWLGEISPGVKAKALEDITRNETGLQFTYPSAAPGIEHEFKPQNTGFGVSYALPVVTALLAAEPGHLVLLENPEAHLHPYGQAKIAELMARAASAGIQVFVETHSDHIINGILVAIKKSENNGNAFDERMARIYFFDRKAKSLETRIIPVPILPGGRILKPPPGFFDQIGKDLKIIMGF